MIYILHLHMIYILHIHIGTNGTPSMDKLAFRLQRK